MHYLFRILDPPKRYIAQRVGLKEALCTFHTKSDRVLFESNTDSPHEFFFFTFQPSFHNPQAAEPFFGGGEKNVKNPWIDQSKDGKAFPL
ncbi:hypothetical protein CEXT_741121 [Caerostris extrusa]|uniref:Uncharacterized protein n=1 Tax=Caerostris extrusa TaxID=172846 RepID=A0AAV4STP1_CAEEX|nr:hypothetical protein CEXT_741121 [Caerostris extrusa]